MIRVYYLETERIGNTDTVKGMEYIHNTILGVEDDLRKLIQDTTDIEHNGLIGVAVSWRAATNEEIELLATLPAPIPDPPDIVLIKKYLADPHSGLPDLETAFVALARLFLGIK